MFKLSQLIDSSWNKIIPAVYFDQKYIVLISESFQDVTNEKPWPVDFYRVTCKAVTYQMKTEGDFVISWIDWIETYTSMDTDLLV